MPNNTDISPLLNQDMTLDRALGDGTTLYTLPVFGIGQKKGEYLYRSMPLSEAKNWFTAGWLPDDSGIPWSTNWEYSRTTYLKGNSVVQLEVPANDILPRIKAVGASPKYEGDGETWGVGPSAEIGRQPSSEANKALVDLYKAYKDSPYVTQDVSKSKLLQKGKEFQNSLFRAMFRDKVTTGRVVARRF